MNAPGGKAYRPWTPELYAQQAHAPAAKLPEDDLVFFLLDVVPKLDLSRIHAPYQDETRGAPPFDPAMMACLLLYAYCVGVFSSRKIAQACERNLAFLAIVGDDRPDFRTISLFRKNHLDAFADVFVQVLRLAAGGRPGPPGHDRRRWDQGPGQRLAAQGDELRLHDQGRGPAAGRDRRVAEAGPGRRCRRTMRPWARGAATSCPRSCAGGRTAWR